MTRAITINGVTAGMCERPYGLVSVVMTDYRISDLASACHTLSAS
jgi:hypothetical protein